MELVHFYVNLILKHFLAIWEQQQQKKPNLWRRLFRVPWTVGRSNQSILKEINPEYSLEGLMLQLKLQYFGHLT